MSRREAFSFFYQGLEKVIPLAEQLRVHILVEPEQNLLMENSQQFKEFIKEVRSPSVGLNFDIGHFFCAGEGPGEAFQELFPWIGHVHLEDIAPSRVHHHLIPGQGAIDLLKTLKTLLRTGYRGDLSLELYTYADRPVEAGQASLKYLLPLFQEAGFDPKELLARSGNEDQT